MIITVQQARKRLQRGHCIHGYILLQPDGESRFRVLLQLVKHLDYYLDNPDFKLDIYAIDDQS